MDRRQDQSVLCRPLAGDVRQMRQWLVLVAAPTRLFARRSGDWSVFHELCGVSARVGHGYPKVTLLRSTCYQLLGSRKADADGWPPQRVPAIAWPRERPPRPLARETPSPSADPQQLRYVIEPALKLETRL